MCEPEDTKDVVRFITASSACEQRTLPCYAFGVSCEHTWLHLLLPGGPAGDENLSAVPMSLTLYHLESLCRLCMY